MGISVCEIYCVTVLYFLAGMPLWTGYTYLADLQHLCSAVRPERMRNMLANLGGCDVILLGGQATVWCVDCIPLLIFVVSSTLVSPWYPFVL